MAATERELMPGDLKDAGWKLEEKRINDGEPEYLARNEARGLETERYPVPATAIAAARKLDSNGKPERSAQTVDQPDENFTSKFGPLPPGVAYRKEIYFDEIRFDGGTQIREELNLERVEQYAEAKERGDVFPPGTVFFDGTDHWIAAGFHRTFADKKNGLDKNVFDVRLGTKREAILYAVGENATHGLGRTNAEKRLAVEKLLNDQEWTEWSDNMIAKAARVSQAFVSAMRREMEALNKKPAGGSRIGMDGVRRDTTKIGRIARSLIDEEESRSEEKPHAHADDDVIPAETDIRVDDEPDTTERRETEPPQQAVSSDDEDLVTWKAEGNLALWNEGMIDLHIRFKADVNAPDLIIVSAKHTQTPTPVFKQFLAADLNPRPPALRSILRDLQEAFDNRGKSQPAATKPKKKRIVASGKKKATKRPAKPVMKKKRPTTSKKKATRPANKKKPVAKSKPKPKARKK